jgi:hypothetical protein
MGIVHRRATVSPSKQELVEAWMPSRPWAAGRTISEKVAEFRLDDPEGEVGVETIVWRAADGALLQTPLTYRAEPLSGGAAHLITTMEHSVLGTRWIYDGCGDPVWADTLVHAVLTGGTQSPMFFESDEGRVDIPARMQVRGSGDEAEAPRIDRVDEVVEGAPTVVRAAGLEIAVAHVLGTPLGEGPHLAGTIGGGTDRHLLAVVRGA